ncbi:MAG: fused response regulator/phosphatase [bacterium]|nr:fused response regulator/phosphatase [bacterium]
MKICESKNRLENNVDPKGSILVVEDDELNRIKLLFFLQRNGHDVTFAVNGKEAVRLMNNKNFDLVLLDILMPEMDGYQVLDYMSRNNKLLSLPVIVISSEDEIKSIVKCIEKGAIDHIRKPFDPDILNARIRICLEKKRKMDQEIKHKVLLEYTNSKLEKENKIFDINLKEETKKNQLIVSDLKAAAKIQKSVLPSINENFKRDDIEIYTKFVPANEMSGDFFDLFHVNDNTIAMIIADVSGKGVSAAFFMSMSKVIIKNTCLQSEELNPGKILQKINKILCKDNEAFMFLTMYLIFYNTKTCEITFANAGHHDMILTDVDGMQIKFGACGNIPVGLYDDEIYRTSGFALNVGDVLTIYTDGISEAFNSNKIEYGEEKVMNLLSLNTGSELKIIGNSLVQDVLAYEEGNRFDDIALLMLRRMK